MNKNEFRLLMVALLSCAVFAAGGARAGELGVGNSFKGPVGLTLLSARVKALGATVVIDQARQWGFKQVEVADAGGLTPLQVKAELDRRGLAVVGKIVPYNRLRRDIKGVIEEAKALGAPAVGCTYITHPKPFDEAQCRAAAAVFNEAGKALAAQGLKFYYHNHGYEFVPYGQGTLFDLLVKETDPRYVSFEMDVLWAVLPGQDPVRLLEKYPGRWMFMHMKDLKKGVPTGDLSADTDKNNDVVLGTGQVNWPALLQAAQKAGVKCYLIEDESPSYAEQIPQSLRFLESVSW